MTAPLDIGLEQNDVSLKMGQEDIFDLTDAQRGLHREGSVARLIGDEEASGGSEGEREDESAMVEILDSDQERERKLSALEVELDGMYNAYQEKLNERDSKRRVKEARRKRGLLEEWNGIGSTNKDTSDEESNEDGSWEKMEARKEMDDDSSSEEERNEGFAVGQKRLRRKPADPPSNKKAKFIDLYERPPPPSRAAQVWFSRDVFKGLKGHDMDEDHESNDIELASNPVEIQSQHSGREVIVCVSPKVFIFDPFTVRARNRRF